MRNAIQGALRRAASIRNLPYAAVAAATVASAPPEAEAGDLKGVASNVNENLGAVGELIIAGAFITGLVLVAAGLVKLKQAADTGGQQVKYGEGLWRLGIGVGLVSLSAIVGIGSGTLGINNNGAGAVGGNSITGF